MLRVSLEVEEGGECRGRGCIGKAWQCLEQCKCLHGKNSTGTLTSGVVII